MDDPVLAILARTRTYGANNYPFFTHREAQPEALALRGFIFTSHSSLLCHICKAEIQIQMHAEAGKQDEQLLGEPNFMKGLTHDGSCPYLNESDTLSNYDLYLSLDCIIELISASFKEATSYPCIDLTSFKKKIFPFKEDLKEVMQRLGVPAGKISVPFSLQLFGWALKKELQQVECIYCGAVLPIASYSKTGPDGFMSEDSATSQAGLDMCSEHRYFCRWYKEDESSQLGWYLLVQHYIDKLIEINGLSKGGKVMGTLKVMTQVDRYLQSLKQKTQKSFEKIARLVQECRQLGSQISKDFAQPEAAITLPQHKSIDMKERLAELGQSLRKRVKTGLLSE